MYILVLRLTGDPSDSQEAMPSEYIEYTALKGAVLLDVSLAPDILYNIFEVINVK